jgi:hypothetical protein
MPTPECVRVCCVRAQLCQGCRARVNYWRSKGARHFFHFPALPAPHPCSRSDDLMETIADSCICNEIDCQARVLAWNTVDLLIFFFLPIVLTIQIVSHIFFTGIRGWIYNCENKSLTNEDRRNNFESVFFKGFGTFLKNFVED